MLRPLPLVAIIFALFLGAPALAQNVQKSGIISLEGRGEVVSAPDMAIISSGVVTMEKTARAALDANSAAMGQLFDLLDAAGIEKRDIQTSNFSVQPQYIYSDQRDQNGYQKPPRIAGYQVSNNVSIKLRDLDKLGSVLDNMVSVGANQINTIDFAINDTAPLLAKARRAAMANAIAKAKLYAEAAGVKLGAIVSISEAAGGIALPRFEAMTLSRGASEQPVPVASGELTFSKQVSVVWKLVQIN
ncbi:hypothetical protein MNBD_ALPHA12-1204 [hydrothermal vent metagenome]|uniref:SIMPL domain-containing protein n=1 Tax=hydrothermal vent metagenome TaxID=652676 RepID=A0A3B0TD94_9ZZZZ